MTLLPVSGARTQRLGGFDDDTGNGPMVRARRAGVRGMAHPGSSRGQVMKASHSTRHKNYRRALKAKAHAKHGKIIHGRKPRHHRKSYYSKAAVAKRALAKKRRIAKHDRTILRAARKRAQAQARSYARRAASRQVAYAKSLSRKQAQWRRSH